MRKNHVTDNEPVNRPPRKLASVRGVLLTVAVLTAPLAGDVGSLAAAPWVNMYGGRHWEPTTPVLDFLRDQCGDLGREVNLHVAPYTSVGPVTPGLGACIGIAWSVAIIALFLRRVC